MTERVKAAKCASSDEVAVRLFAEEDSVQELTCLLHRAYADHAAAGRVFFASYQSSQDTAHRLRKGECWLALQETSLVGTVTVVTPYVAPEGYPAPAGAGSFWQLAVDPSQRGTGLGRSLAVCLPRVRRLLVECAGRFLGGDAEGFVEGFDAATSGIGNGAIAACSAADGAGGRGEDVAGLGS